MKRIADGKGARIAFDPVGGKDFPKLIAALAPQGTVYLYGTVVRVPPRCRYWT